MSERFNVPRTRQVVNIDITAGSSGDQTLPLAGSGALVQFVNRMVLKLSTAVTVKIKDNSGGNVLATFYNCTSLEMAELAPDQGEYFKSAAGGGICINVSGACSIGGFMDLSVYDPKATTGYPAG